MPDKIAAIAVIEAGLTRELQEMAINDTPVPTLLLLGTEDPLVPFKGGAIAAIFGGRGVVLPASQTIQFWTERNHCFAVGTTTELAPRRHHGLLPCSMHVN